MWIALSIVSAILLGVYDVAKKHSLRCNGVLWVLAVTSLLSTVLMAPFAGHGPLPSHLMVLAKAVLVSVSWISGLAAMKLMPLTTLSTMKASRPVFVVLFSCLLFSERLEAVQWAGVLMVFGALFVLSRVSSDEGISFSRSRGVFYVCISIFSGVASALYDKTLLRSLEPTFVQFWADLYITVLMFACLFVQSLKGRAGKFRWDWTLVVIALLITGADACYFFALKSDGALLSIVSLVRRASVAVTFGLSAVVFRENRLKGKAVALLLLLAGLTVLCLPELLSAEG